MPTMRYDPTRAALLHPEQQPPLGPEWPWNEAATLAEFARLAYFRFEKDAEAESTLRGALAAKGYGGFAGFSFDGKQVGKHRFDTQAFAVISDTGTAVVAFRGTQSDSPHDILADLSFLPTEWKGAGKVHNGFWASLDESLSPIRTWLDKAQPRRLIVTGHSLGAAQATLLAGIRPEAELVTFGSPLVGNAEFVASYAGRKMQRYVDCLDIVTRVPPLIYRHLDGLQYIDRHGRLHAHGLNLVDSLEERAEAVRSYVLLATDTKNCPLRDLADHAPINYVSALLRVRAD